MKKQQKKLKGIDETKNSPFNLVCIAWTGEDKVWGVFSSEKLARQQAKRFERKDLLYENIIVDHRVTVQVVKYRRTSGTERSKEEA